MHTSNAIYSILVETKYIKINRVPTGPSTFKIFFSKLGKAMKRNQISFWKPLNISFI